MGKTLKSRIGKKGFFMGLPADVVGWFLFFLSILSWGLIFGVVRADITFKLDAQHTPSFQDLAFINILRTPFQDTTIVQLVIEAHQQQKKDRLELALDQALNTIYGDPYPVCWKLWYYDAQDTKQLLAGTGCKATKQLFSGKTVIPLPDTSHLRLELAIPGLK